MKSYKSFFRSGAILLLFICTLTNQAQEKYWVYLKGKEKGNFVAEEFFDAKALERRARLGINPDIEEEWPVNTEYIARIGKIVDSVSYASRWFNAVSVYADIEQVNKLLGLDFVSHVEPQYLSPVLCKHDEGPAELDFSSQVLNMQGDKFAAAGINGRGIRIAVFDAGFPGVNTNPCFEHIRRENRIIQTWDFTRNQPDVYRANSHGTAVLSCIGGISNNSLLGLATGAEFLLARTEVRAEILAEEENWLAAVEWADRNGADIINSSLGYTQKRYFPEQMDGKTSLASRAATLAARKGILVVNAAGNEGTSMRWRVIGAPADADSILSVGGINPQNGIRISFSSYGPTADGRLKPNVCAFGSVMAATKNSTGTTQGTSFASPLVAGFAACAMQCRPGITNMELLEEIQRSASLYPYFDYAHGYGVPQASYFLEPIKSKTEPAFAITKENRDLVVTIKPESLKRNKNDYVYYHFAGENNRIIKYYVQRLGSKDSIVILPGEVENASILRIHYNGYTYEMPISEFKP